MLPWSFTAHYDSEPERREEFHRLLDRGMPSGYAADDGAALHFVGRGLHRVVGSRPGVAGYALRRGPERRDRGSPRGRLPRRRRPPARQPRAGAGRRVVMPPRIVALGGHEFRAQPGELAIVRHLLELTGAERPRVCLLPTASGDPQEEIANFYSVLDRFDCVAVARLAVPARARAGRPPPSTCWSRT